MSPYSEKVATRIEIWRRKLIDLSRRNRLLNFRPTKASTVEIVDEIPQQILRQLVDGEVFEFDPIPDEDDSENLLELSDEEAPDADPRWKKRGVEFRKTNGEELESHYTDNHLQTPHYEKRLDKNLLQIYRLAESSMEEQGVNTLFLALGMLEWYESRDSDVVNRAPVLLVPVNLTRKDASSPFELSLGDDEPVINPAISEKLRLDFQLELPPLPDLSEDLDFSEVFSAVKAAVNGFPRWRITNDVALGLFSFQKFLMYKDLELNADRFHSHTVIRALSGESEGGESLGLPSDIAEADLDTEMGPWDSCQVVDADSSQQRAVLAIRNGYNLVIEGPPGTGKSQTITNVIAQALSDGKKVLFVSEKMAALEVVKTRLEEVGLGGFCLELHSHKVAKRSFVSELARSLDEQISRNADGEKELRRLKEISGELRAYVVALHEPFGVLGWSPFRALARLAELEDLADIKVRVDGIETCDADDFDSLLIGLRDLQAILEETGNPATHPLRGLGIKKAGRLERAEFQEALEQASSDVLDLIELADVFCDSLGFASAETLGDVELSLQAAGVVGRSPGSEMDVLQNPGWNSMSGDVTALLETGRRYATIKSEVLKCFTEPVLQTNIGPEIDALETFSHSFGRFFKPEFWRVRKYLRSFRRPGYKPNGAAGFLVDLRLAHECREKREFIDGCSEHARSLFGRRWKGPESDWSDLESFADWVVELRTYALKEVLTQKGLSLVAEATTDQQQVQEWSQALEVKLAAVRASLERLTGVADAREESGVLARPATSLKALPTRLAELAAAADHLRTWASLNERLAGLKRGPASDFVTAVGGNVGHEQLAESFERQFLTQWFDLACGKRPALDQFRTNLHETRISDFRDLDRRSMQIAKEQVRAALANQRQGLLRPELQGQLQLVQREARKKSRIKPVRQLLRQGSDVIQLIKPCFMMSPLSVAQFADPNEVHFDLLVFDEASQITPADAVGAFIRADRVVVVGDSKQLPPTDFFSAQIDHPDEMDSDEEDGLFIHDDLESILAEASVTAGVPSLRLKWHYRSEDESLIRFSNEEFYSDDPLYTFPSAQPDSPEHGLHFEYVPDGVYEGGGVNGREAGAVADAVIRHIRECPDLTLGVGTFGMKQQTRILDELEQRRRMDPSIEFFFARQGERKFFVKNLENIQGDDRDVIFLSVTYGPNAAGTIRRNFGPINSENGWRRLNVITTRSKKKLVVFSSMRADEIDVSGSIASGVLQLRNYLRYAETRKYPTTKIHPADPDSPFEESVIGELRARGYETVPQVGEAGYRIDIGVIDPAQPGRFVCGIECDGASYHSAATVRDRDRLRQQVLESRGWEIHRIWSTDWFQDRSAQIERVVGLIEESKTNYQKREVSKRASEKRSTDLPSTPAPAAEEQSREPAADPVPSGIQIAIEDIPVPLYQFAEPDRVRDPEDFYTCQVSKLSDVVKRVVSVEGPIHKDELARRVAAYWGMERAGRKIAERVAGVARKMVSKGRITKDGDFYCSIVMDRPPVRSRDIDGVNFQAEHVSEAEAAEAVRLLLKHRSPILPDELPRQVARVLGYKRAGAKIQELIATAVQHLVERGELEAGGMGLRLTVDGAQQD
jgi:hypothetical protein